VEGVPNTRATVQEVWDGMSARSQNAWPSLSFDALGVNDWAFAFLSAGFYYKTFMWPRAFWEAALRARDPARGGPGSLSGKAGRRSVREGLGALRPPRDRGGARGLAAALSPRAGART
jgi:sarcosine oxidase subunit alpha